MPRSPHSYSIWRASDDGRVVFAEFTRRALRLRAAGYKHFGSQAIAESIRYDAAVRLKGDGFRVNNSHIARLAREVMASDARLTGFFETRRSRADLPS